MLMDQAERGIAAAAMQAVRLGNDSHIQSSVHVKPMPFATKRKEAIIWILLTIAGLAGVFVFVLFWEDRQDRRQFEFMMMTAMFALVQNDCAQAKQIGLELTSRDKVGRRDYRAYMMLGDAATGLGEYAFAEARYRTALKMMSRNPQVSRPVMGFLPESTPGQLRKDREVMKRKIAAVHDKKQWNEREILIEIINSKKRE